MNQNTILIMIVVGMAVIVFLIILYCFQQRQREANRAASELEGRKEMFYLTTHSTHFIYGYMASDIW